jgi:hypothetical protein
MQLSYKLKAYDHGDEAVLQVYDGAWRTVHVFDTDTDDDTYRSISIDLADVGTVSGIRVSNAAVSEYGKVWVDNIEMKGQRPLSVLRSLPQPNRS